MGCKPLSGQEMQVVNGRTFLSLNICYLARAVGSFFV